jgi:hypothetical protein
VLGRLGALGFVSLAVQLPAAVAGLVIDAVVLATLAALVARGRWGSRAPG